ncbi:MAG TPA: MiaB/RimO family radical SAM methylthiotransferase [Terracidiphilus sp.]
MPNAFHIENFGCRAARADGEAIAERLRASGHSLRQPSEADVVIVNTCSVTAEADREARAYVRRAHRLNPEARIVVTGCYAQRAPEELAGLPGVAAVIGNSHKALAPEIVTRLAAGDPQPALHQSFVPIRNVADTSGALAPIWADDHFAHSFLEEAQLAPGAQTRPNLKIQEGCGNRCTFCVIPQTRGNSRSLPEDKVLTQVRGFVDAGGNELVLSGINLGRWGRDLPPHPSESRHSLAEMVRRIFAETDLPRLRLSSIEPMDWDAQLISLLREFGGVRLARHAHLPLQSGSDSVLRRMHRRYRPWHYSEKVLALRQAAGPGLTLGADVMVGFPGETDGEFQETADFIRSHPFGYLHLFPFSPRPGTPGWDLHRRTPVPAAVVEQRMAALRLLGSEKSRAHRSSFVGGPLECITLHTPEALRMKNLTTALSDNFLPVELEGSLAANSFVTVQVTGLSAAGAVVGIIQV